MEDKNVIKSGVQFEHHLKLMMEVALEKNILYFHTVYGKFIVFQN